MPPESHSITRWIDRLKDNDPRAASVLWERFVERMLAVARNRLRNTSRRVADEDDVVVVAFQRFHDGVRNGRFPKLDDRNDLWAILFTLTTRHAIRQVRHLKRQKYGGGAVRGDSALNPADGPAIEPMDDGLSPDEAALIQEQVSLLLGSLDASLREIALAHIEGLTNAEIAARIGKSVVTVERRLHRIRETWGDVEEKSVVG